MLALGNEETVRKAYILMHPLRYRIAKLLDSAENGQMYIAQIARELGDVEKYRKLVTHHLLVMDQYGLTNNDYGPRGGPPTEESGRPVIVNYFKLTPEAKEILSKIQI